MPVNRFHRLAEQVWRLSLQQILGGSRIYDQTIFTAIVFGIFGWKRYGQSSGYLRQQRGIHVRLPDARKMDERVSEDPPRAEDLL